MPNLNIPTSVTITIGDAEAQQIAAYWSTEQAVAQSIANMGLLPLPKPKYVQPSISPEQINNLDNAQFSDYYARFVEYANYVEVYVSYINAAIMAKKATCKGLEERIIKELLAFAKDNKEKKPTKDVLTNSVAVNPYYQKALYEKCYLEQQQTILTAHLEALMRTVQMLSRSIEIRRLNWSANSVGNNIQNRTPHPYQHSGGR